MQIILEDISQGCQEQYILIFKSELEVNIISQGDLHLQIYNRLVFNFLIFFPLLTITLKATL